MTSPLDPSQLKVVKLLRRLPPLHKYPPKVMRILYILLDRLLGIKKVKLDLIKDFTLKTHDQTSQIKIKFYYPNTKQHGEAQIRNASSAMMYFHGGGCVIGSIQSHDRLCRHLAEHSNTIVISVNYRLAPEHKYPYAIIDAIQAWNWLQDYKHVLGLNDCKIGVGGDSAGAYLACLLSMKPLQQPLPLQVSTLPEFQYLLYPMLDLRLSSQSFFEVNESMLLTKELMLYFRHHYLNSTNQSEESLASPLLVDDLSEQPKTYLLSLEHDPLKDDGIAFANKLKQSGIETEHQHFDDCMHSFVSTFKVSKRAQSGVDEITRQLKILST